MNEILLEHIGSELHFPRREAKLFDLGKSNLCEDQRQWRAQLARDAGFRRVGLYKRLSR